MIPHCAAHFTLPWKGRHRPPSAAVLRLKNAEAMPRLWSATRRGGVAGEKKSPPPGALSRADLPQGEVKKERLSRHAQMQTGLLLQIADDGEEVFRLRIAARAEHADQALGGRAGRLGELFEAD